MGQNNIIELNGKRYDALTGRQVGDASFVPVKRANNGRRMVDGFVRRSAATFTPQVIAPAAPEPKEIPKPIAKATPAKPGKLDMSKRMDVKRPSAHPAKARQQQRGQTLMRRAVKRPDYKLKTPIKTQSPAELAAPANKTIAHPLTKKLSVTNVNQERLERAQTIEKDQRVRRFGTVHAHSVHHGASASARPNQNKEVHSSAHLGTSQHLRTVAAQPRPHTTQRPQPDIFEAAIAHARSHEQKAPKIRRKNSRLVNLLAGSGAFLLIAGFVAYLNLPNIEVKVASFKAGIHASMPDYRPTGYALSDVNSEDGKVRLSFRSGENFYTITQTESDWDSQSLLDNYVTFAGSDHNTIQSNGRTIYVYNGNKATWVDGGTRYDLTGNAPLTDEDLSSLAASM